LVQRILAALARCEELVKKGETVPLKFFDRKLPVTGESVRAEDKERQLPLTASVYVSHPIVHKMELIH